MPRLCISLAATTLLLPIAVLAQPLNLGIHISRNDALPTSPHLFGLSLASYTGPFGARLNGGLHFTEREPDDPYRTSKVGIGAWSADADVIFAPLRPAQRVLGISPYAFVGIGGMGGRLPDVPDTSFATWSFGGGASVRFAGPVALEADARYRQPIDRDAILPAGYGDEWEYRLGLTIGLGGGKKSRRSGTYHSRSTRPHPPARRSEPAPRREGRHGSAAAITSRAERHVGVRYRYGGTSPSSGFDCSGFVQYVYGREGVRLPRTSRQQAAAGERVSLRRSALREGDLMFFANDGRRIDHVAIYAGGGRIIHASASGNGVRYDDLDDARGRWFLDRWVEARRVTDGGRSLVRGYASDEAHEGELDPPDRAPLPERR